MAGQGRYCVACCFLLAADVALHYPFVVCLSVTFVVVLGQQSTNLPALAHTKKGENIAANLTVVSPPPSFITQLDLLQSSDLFSSLYVLSRTLGFRSSRRRGKLARMHVAAKRAATLAEEGGGGGGSPMTVAEWLPSYGTDPYYPSRRIRRITERVYFKVTLAMSRFDGFVFVEGCVFSFCATTRRLMAA